MLNSIRRSLLAASVIAVSLSSAQAQTIKTESVGSLTDFVAANLPVPEVSPIAAPDGDPGALTVYATRDDFDANVGGQSCEDYEDTNIAPTTVFGFPAPINSTTNNGVILPGQIAEGVDIQDNPLNDAGGGSPLGVATIGAGFFGADSDYIVANTFVDTFELILNPAPNSVAMDLRTLLGGATATVQFFNEADVLIGTVDGAAAVAAGDFIGVSAPEPIGRVTVFDPGNGAEGGDNICWGNLLGEGPARFQVTKDFDDDNPTEVDVVIQCNTGLPLMQPASISEGDGVTFVVNDFEDGNMNCQVTETVPEGYTASYNNGDETNNTGCAFEGVRGGSFNTCVITNSLNEVDVEVSKVWIDENPQFNPVNYAEASWFCSNVAFTCDPDGVINNCDSGNLQFLGNPGSDSFSVFPSWDGGTVCTVSEAVIADGNVESDGSECVGVTLFPGAGASCTIYNTRLYAGIPTLSQYGLGVLVLLMLGVGLVGFRRFV